VSIPVEPLVAPDTVVRLARGAALTPVWLNELGGMTFRTDDGRFIKHGPRNAETSFAGEAARLAWAAPHTPVPRLLEVGGDETHEWLVMAALPGLSAVDPRWVAEPVSAVRAVGEGLRALHDALPVADCPFDWGVPSRIANAAGRGWAHAPGGSGRRASGAWWGRGDRVPDALREPPPVDRLVVCHGDACCPNTLVGDDGRWSAHVDLGALGVADRWADIAVASMSTAWNYGEGWEDALIEAYGIAPDRERLSYYRELWNAT
jgi:kanamycin kinase